MQGGLYVLSRQLAVALSTNETRRDEKYSTEDASTGWLIYQLVGSSGRLTLINGKGCEQSTHDYRALQFKASARLQRLCAPAENVSSARSAWFHPLK